LSGQPIVQVEDIDVFYRMSQILFGEGLSVRQGETTALLGRNDAGKSTTMKASRDLPRPGAGTEHTVQDNLLIGQKRGAKGPRQHSPAISRPVK